MGNENLHQALKNKNDEFYTFYEDIEKECNNYISFFINKIIYLICDNRISPLAREHPILNFIASII